MKILLSLLLTGMAIAIMSSCQHEGEHPRTLNAVLPRDTINPEIIWISPSDGDTAVSIRKPIIVMFTEDLNHSSVTPQSFVIVPEVNAERSVCRTTAACTVWTYLDYSTIYDVTITTDITDTAGNALLSDMSWSFATRDPPPPPVITGFTPTEGPVGIPVNIFGTGFDTVLWENTVHFDGDSAVILSGSDTCLKACVPRNANTGPITVENQIAVDSSENDFIVWSPRDTLSGTDSGIYMLIENFDTPEADTISQYITITWFKSGVYLMYLDVSKQPESERQFCDVGGSYSVANDGILLDEDSPNFTSKNCNTTRNPDGFFGAGLVNVTLYMIHYTPHLNVLKKFSLTH